MILSDSIADFLAYKETYTLPKTVLNYRDCLFKFGAFIGISSDVCRISQKDVERYQRYLRSLSLSDASIATYLRQLKVFLHWLGDEMTNPPSINLKRIKLPKTYKKAVRLYSSDEILMLFDSAKVSVPWITVRNHLILALMYDSGLRQSEVASICRSLVDISSHTMIVKGKGNKQRTVPLGKMSISLIQKYLSLCPYRLDYLLVDRRGNPLSANALKLMMHKISKKVPFKVSCHLLRHNFATNYLLNQLEEKSACDIYSLMTLMGHSEVSVTMQYLHQAQDIYASRHCTSQLDKVFFQNA